MLISATRSKFVDLDVPAGAWVALVAVIAAMLAIDLYRHREAHAPTAKEAEEQLLYKDMQLDLARQILRHVAAVKREL